MPCSPASFFSPHHSSDHITHLLPVHLSLWPAVRLRMCSPRNHSHSLHTRTHCAFRFYACSLLLLFYSKKANILYVWPDCSSSPIKFSAFLYLLFPRALFTLSTDYKLYRLSTDAFVLYLKLRVCIRSLLIVAYRSFLLLVSTCIKTSCDHLITLSLRGSIPPISSLALFY